MAIELPLVMIWNADRPERDSGAGNAAISSFGRRFL
jgi:hypothetical protein